MWHIFPAALIAFIRLILVLAFSYKSAIFSLKRKEVKVIQWPENHRDVWLELHKPSASELLKKLLRAINPLNAVHFGRFFHASLHRV